MSCAHFKECRLAARMLGERPCVVGGLASNWAISTRIPLYQLSGRVCRTAARLGFDNRKYGFAKPGVRK